MTMDNFPSGISQNERTGIGAERHQVRKQASSINAPRTRLERAGIKEMPERKLALTQACHLPVSVLSGFHGIWICLSERDQDK